MTGEKFGSSDKLISDFISSHPGEEFDSLIRGRDAEFFFHLSSLRESLLSWYPFRNTGTVLEIGGGFGALTGFLSEKFEHADVLEPDPLRAESLRKRYSGRNNISFYGETIERYEASKKYDAIIYTELVKEEKYSVAVLLDKLASLVRDDGVVLLGFSNRLGAKYECGGLSRYVNTPFETGMLYSKQDLKDALESRFTSVKWYYPMPDERFVLAVYTDQSDFGTVSDRVLCFDGYDSPYIDDEKQKLNGHIDDGTITEHANYCLAELRKKPSEDMIREVYLSPDREKGRRYRVTVMENTVEKAPLDEHSITTLEQSHRNLMHLQSRGIPVVTEAWNGEKIIMQRIKGENLLFRLSMVKSRDEIIDLFDRMYRNILISSDHDDKNVLSTGYIDMIPFNIFINGSDLLYYDQEFTIPDCEAGYIMFRALQYSWRHVPKLNNIVSLAEMKNRYAITEEKWKEYLNMEAAFVAKNRSFEIYPQISSWVCPSGTEIHANRARLLGYDPAKQREIHKVELDILKYFMEFCEDHGLSWFALHGTLLGAVRHGGFIPWDNDIDIGMRREDFDRMVSLFENDSAHPYFLHTMRNEYYVFHGGYARLQRLDTAQIEPPDRYRPGHYGIGLDIFPLDFCEEDPDKFISAQKRITNLQRFIYAKLYPNKAGKISDAEGSLVSFFYIVRHLIPMRVLKYALEKCFRKKKYSSKRAILACYYKDGINQNIFEDQDTKDLSKLPFEDIEIPVIGNAAEYLMKRYGNNYMETHGRRQIKDKGTIYDAHKSYIEYRGW